MTVDPADQTGPISPDQHSTVLGGLWPVGTTPTAYDPLPGDARYDVTVVGAGITGLTTAVMLARAGVSVAVLEARTVGAGTTGHSSAKVTVQHGLKWDSLLRSIGEEDTRTYAQMNTFGLSWILENGEGAALERTSATTWTSDPSQVGTFEAEVAAAQRVGVDLRLDDGTALLGTVAAAVRLDDQAQFDPYAYLLTLAAEVAGTPGCAVHEGTRVTGVDDSRTPSVRTDRGTVSSDHVVVATGIPVLDRSLAFARTTPHRSYVVAGHADGPLPDGMFVNADSPTRSLRTAPDGAGGRVVLLGGDGHKPAHGPDEREHLANLTEWGVSTFGLRDVVASWGAQDYSSLDGLPYVGPIVPLPTRVYYATGYAKWGMTNGTAAAKVLTDRILGVENPWADLVDPRRLRAKQSALPLAKAQADVGSHLASGWVAPSRPVGPLAEGEGAVERHGLTKHGRCVVDGVTHEVSAVCPHLGGILRWNGAEKSWDCPLHGSRFAPDGARLEGPAVDDLKKKG